jgi:hypothetical protein
MATLYKLKKPTNYIGKILAIGKEDARHHPDGKQLYIGAIGEVDKVSHFNHGMISCFFYPLKQAKANKNRALPEFAFFAQVRIQRIKEKI